jgi:pimeloyl-ACP methyl ester carboxylesterase
MGQHGSSGWQGNRRSELEVAITRAALSAIKEKERIASFDLVGQSAGGMLAIALAASRNDVHCLALASSPSDFALFARTFGISLRTSGRLAHYLPTADIPRLAAKPDLRVIALTDPKDTIVPPPVQASFVAALRAAGKPVLQVMAHARGDEHHALIEQGLTAASVCAAGKSDEAITWAAGK